MDTQKTSNLLFNSVQEKILKLLYLNMDTDFNTNEIIKFSRSGHGAVQRELKKLTLGGLIILENRGNQKRYQANKKLSYFSELKSIIIKTFGLAEMIKDALTSNVKHCIIALIYGSFAKHTESPGSDIDLLLIGEELTYADLFHMLQDTEALLGRKINPSIYSPDEWIKKYKDGNNFIRNIIIQPKIFLIGSEDEFKELG